MIGNIAQYAYPSSNLNEYNLDWLINKVADLENASTFVLHDSYEPTTRTLTLDVRSVGGN